MSVDMQNSSETPNHSQLEVLKDPENRSLFDFCDWSSIGSSDDISISR